jgi:osmotically-inducible protein OsmY
MTSTGNALTAAVALLAAYGLAGCTTVPHRTAAERAADAKTADRVEAALLADPRIYARHIDVDVDRGVVHLGGFVWDIDDYRTARLDAASVAGVTTVVTDMELDRGGVSGTGK